MVQVLQRGRLNQVAVHNLDMHMCFQLKFWSWYNAIMKTTFHVMEIRKALDIESNRCTAGSLYCPWSQNGFSFTLN